MSEGGWVVRQVLSRALSQPPHPRVSKLTEYKKKIIHFDRDRAERFSKTGPVLPKGPAIPLALRGGGR